MSDPLVQSMRSAGSWRQVHAGFADRRFMLCLLAEVWEGWCHDPKCVCRQCYNAAHGGTLRVRLRHVEEQADARR